MQVDYLIELTLQIVLNISFLIRHCSLGPTKEINYRLKAQNELVVLFYKNKL